jgi:flagellar biogenesis protein FliO
LPPPEVDYGAALVRMLISLAVCIGLLVLTVWFLRRMMQAKFQRANKEQTIHVLEKRMISPKSALYLIELEGKRILVAESQFEIKMKFLNEEKEVFLEEEETPQSTNLN